MSSKVAIAVSAALMSMSLNAAESQLTPLGKSPAGTQAKVSAKSAAPAVFTPEADLGQGTYRYLIRLSEDPVALYQGNISGYKATSPAVAKSAAKTADGKLNIQSDEVKAYRGLLNKRQDQVIAKAEQMLSKLDIKQRTTLAFNGMVVEMTQAEAEKLAKVEGIAQIKREQLRHLTTDAGPAFIKAPSVWDGSASGTAYKGEGLIVGVLDTGINSDHPSFADVGADGYDHTNPNGSGVYSGDCATEEWAGLCNDKLIGVHSYPLITDDYPLFDDTVPANGVDHNGHGSHTASTTAGNVLKNVTLDNGLEIEEMSGVAPHANIISYQVCLPGETGDSINFDGCYPSLTILAVEHAIEAGVDVINYSVGGGSSDPWQDGDSLAFLSARKAGIHVATSAGNDGPDPSTLGSPSEAPWITTVAAGTHDRQVIQNQVSVNDKSYDYSNSSGPDVGAENSGQMTFAGSVDEANVEGCSAFAADAFKDKIALISRGSCNFSDKIINAADAGASAVIVYNNRGGDDAALTMSGLEDTTIPSVFVSENSGNAIISALADNADLNATFVPVQVVEADGGEMADFSSRGPNLSVADILSPSITAPGVGILAAYADEMSAGMIEFPAPSDYGFSSGTSMASPHVAGSLALLAGLQPSWTPAQAQSALMLTANQQVLKEDGETPADFFDMGSGYANVALAAASGLVMDESYDDYVAANPAIGGKPSALNLPSMANASCIGACSWTRTVTATSDASWNASAEILDEAGGLTVTVSPESFELAAGESQELTISADVSSSKNDWNFANIKLTAAGMPDAQLPLAVKAGESNLPETLALYADGAQGSKTYSGYQDNKLAITSASLYTKQEVLSQETDELQENFAQEWQLDLTEDAALVLFSLGETTAPDLDLYVYDADNNLLGSSATATSNESITLTDVAAGMYKVEVVNYQASVAGGTDSYELNISAIYRNEASQDENVTVSVVQDESSDEFSLKFDWDLTGSLDETTSGLLYLNTEDGSSHAVDFTLDLTEIAPTAVISASAASVVEEQMVTLTGSTAFNKNGVELTYQWEQLSGPQVSFDANAQSISFQAPKVSQDESLSFSLTVTEANGNTSTETASVNVINRRNGGGGSFGWLTLLAAPLLFLRRMKK
ncbi:S8 family serine peptidase [Thalassomonas viridans]|uniref:S8 family serine peptidase n=1 Tax=Thalassomonas viridans TaxID=137584 RepID=A0AAE9Z2K3_9GAMM|nr:S8 family serine peptidase [Thalassomonas viridans]WDE05621.1 S8 family serine peptidase [Thalassomonas viridans]